MVNWNFGNRRIDWEAACSSRTFPASHPNEYLSVRGWNSDGDEIELGMIRDIAQWSDENRREISEALRRRYLMREIFCDP